ncbi:MAG: secretin N-terminal domain-containing protein [Fimbriimonadaceae bacterium]
MNQKYRALLTLCATLAFASSHAGWLSVVAAAMNPQGSKAAPVQLRQIFKYPSSSPSNSTLTLIAPSSTPNLISEVKPQPSAGLKAIPSDFVPVVIGATGAMIPDFAVQTSLNVMAPLVKRVRREFAIQEAPQVATRPTALVLPGETLSRLIEKPSGRGLPAVFGDGGQVATEGAKAIVISPDKNIKVAAKGKTTPAGDIDLRVCSIVGSGLSLSDALSMLSESTGANVMLVTPVETKLTVRLVNIRLAEALDHICALSGLAKLRMGNTYVLGTPETLKVGYPNVWAKTFPPKPEPTPTILEAPKVAVEVPDPTVSVTVSLSNVDAGSLATAIKGILGDKITAVAGPGSLMPSLADRETGTTTGVAQGVVQSDGHSISKTLLLRGPQSLVEEAEKLVKQLDIPRAQVAIAVTISDVTDSGLKELGLNWTPGGFNIGETVSSGVNFGTFSRTGLSFAASIKALETVDKAKLLASPSVSVMDGQRAFVLIGSRLKFPEVVGYSTNGNPIITTKEERVGVYLQVAPEVSTDGMITLSLYPQVSTVVGFTEIGGGSYPQIDSREAQTTLRVKSGDTVVIGGLYKNEEIEKIQQVPLLSRIPILGELFKSRKRTKAASQVIISLSLKLIIPEQK